MNLLKWGQHLLGALLIGVGVTLLFEIITGVPIVVLLGGPFIAAGTAGIVILIAILLCAWGVVSED